MRAVRLVAMLLGAALLFAGTTGAQTAAPAAQRPAIEAGSEVAIEYTLRDDTGQVLDSNTGQFPMTFTQGAGQVIRGLEAGLAGARVGETRRFSVEPGDAYGPVNPAAVAEVPKAKLPAEALKVGAYVVAHGPDGHPRLVRVLEVQATSVVIDLNHPLAGKVLHFEVKVVEVRPARK